MAYIRMIRLKSPDDGESPSNWEYIWNVPTYRTFGGTINTPVTPTPLPEEDESNNVLIKIEGNSATGRLIYVQGNGSDEAITLGTGATITSNVNDKPIGIWTILNAVRNHFKPVSIADSYLWQVIGDASLPRIGSVSSSAPLYSARGTFVKLDWSMASPVAMRWNINFIEGNVTASFDFEPPLTPSVSFVESSGSIQVTAQKNVSDTGDNPDGMVIEFTLLTGSPRTEIYRPSSPAASMTYTLTGLSGTYSIRAAFLRGNSTGSFSTPRLLVV